MWNKWPITLKIIVPLAAMQFGIATLGIGFLASFLYKTRMRELNETLKTQSDAIESSISWEDGHVVVPTDSELIRDLSHDPSRFVRIVDQTGRLLYESQGVSKSVQARLASAFQHRPATEEVTTLIIEDHAWRSIFEDMELPTQDHGASGVTLLNATDFSGPMEELEELERILLGAGLATVLLTVLSTVGVVAISTRNISKLSRHLVSISPDDPQWTFPQLPRSREEHHLFHAFATILARIRKVQKDQKLFIANASHELKTPIAGILAALEVILSRPRSPADYVETCNDILVVARDMERLTGALLNIARLDEQVISQLNEIHITDICRGLIERWDKVASRRSIRIRAKGLERSWTCRGQREYIEIAVGNILDNAIKYSANGGPIDFELSGGVMQPITIRIRDYGVGMLPDQLAQLGTTFYRADEARSGQGSFGLGYAHALRFINAMGGTLRATSVFGSGSEFTIELPQFVNN